MHLTKVQMVMQINYMICLIHDLQGFTYPVRSHYLEDFLEMSGYKLTSLNQVDDYGQEKMWKTQKHVFSRKRKNQLTSLVEVWSF
jgi:ATP-dependent RNA helicase DHX36